MKRLGRAAWIAAPFLLLAVGFYALVRSPWPSIVRLALRGEHVRVFWTWTTAGLGLLALACFTAAVALSLTIRRQD